MERKIRSVFIKIFIITFSLLSLPLVTNAKGDDLEVSWFDIMPKLTWGQINKINGIISGISHSGWNVRKLYNSWANELDTPSQLASGIMNRDTILNYIVFVVKYLSQLGLLVWACFIMYAWYRYMLSIFNWWKTPSSTLKNAIIWVIIVIFSYAIMRILTSIIWLT